MINRTLGSILKKLKDTSSEVRIEHFSGTYYGKIHKIGWNNIILKPYIVGENIRSGETTSIERRRIEKNIGLPLSKKGIIPIKLSDGYIDETVKASNYFNWKSVKNSALRDNLFEGYILPTEEETKLIEENPKYFGKIKSEGKDIGSVSDGIGFKF